MDSCSRMLHVCILHTYTRTHAHTHTHMHPYLPTCRLARHIRAHTQPYSYVHRLPYVHTCTRPGAEETHTQIHIHVHIVSTWYHTTHYNTYVLKRISYREPDSKTRVIHANIRVDAQPAHFPCTCTSIYSRHLCRSR